jgi:competence protein ComEC
MTQSANLLILDVGHGNASVIQENDTNILIDTSTKAKLREHLQKLGIKNLDAVILSHSDFDHIGGLVGLLSDEGFSIKRVFLNADAKKDSEAWNDLLFALDGAEATGKIEVTLGLKTGPLKIEGLQNVSLEVAAPSIVLAGHGVGAKDADGQSITSNSLSAVIRVIYEDKPVALLAGDMDEVSLTEIQRKKTDISARFLVFPHHGGLPGTGDPAVFTKELLESVKPETVLFSHGREKFSNPNEVILATVMAHGSITVACTQLSKRCAVDVPIIDRVYDETVHSSGRTGGLCCSGTLRISLTEGVVVEPTLTLHKEFILQHVPLRQCVVNPAIM